MSVDSSFTPIYIAEIELSQPLPELVARRQRDSQVFGSAKLTIRLHDDVLGQVDVPLVQPKIAPADYIPAIWDSLKSSINAHLKSDGLPEVNQLISQGIDGRTTPRCKQERQAFLNDAPFASVVICSHDRTEFLRDCLPPLINLSYPNYEIVVVDNAPSSSETYDFIHNEYGDNPIVRYVREDQAGLSWARNCGIRHARGEFVAFTDDDAIVDEHWLTRLMMAFNTLDSVMCVTGLAIPYELETQSQVWFEQFGGLGNGFERQIFDMGEHRRDNLLYPYTVGQYGAGVNMAFRTAWLRNVGGFEISISQADDISMFVKVITNGYRIIYEPNALVHHKHRRDYEGLKRQIFNYGIGLSIFIIHLVISDWLWLIKISPRIPAGIWHMLNPRSYKNKNKQRGYPAELTWLERKGLIKGPFQYFKYINQIRGLYSSVEPEFDIERTTL